MPLIDMDAGIPIGKDAFRALVARYLGRIESGQDMPVEDYVTMTRLWNTIQFRELGPEDDLFQRYSAAFYPAYLERVSKSLEATLTKGMAFYSRKHDLYIGGTPHANSQYKLQQD